MFGSDFYPTPKEVIETMLSNSSVANKIILEPSAGKGDIVDYLISAGAKEVIACELNNDLCKILMTKCNIIANDFLTLKSEDISHIDMIVMNPPFSADEDHIIHAYDIAPPGCEIISLCNSSILTGYRTTKQEKLFELIDLYGFSDDLGRCFDTAERTTHVYVSMVVLYKPKSRDEEFEGYFSMQEEVDNPDSGIIKYNEIQDIVNRYVGSVKLFDEVIHASSKINQMASVFDGFHINFGAYYSNKSNQFTTITRDVYKKALQKSAWKLVFSKLNMNKYMTKSVREKINKFVEKQVHVPFTMYNIYRMLDIIIGTHAERMDSILVEAFDAICSYSSKNSTAGEKWKTNSDYMINKRFIIPYITTYESWRHDSPYVYISYSSDNSLDDIIKALCYLTGVNYDNTSCLSYFINQNKILWGKWACWGFFKIRGYKKGTMHFEFNDDDVWMSFNRKVAEIKGWQLPKSTNKAYRAKPDTVDLFS